MKKKEVLANEHDEIVLTYLFLMITEYIIHRKFPDEVINLRFNFHDFLFVEYVKQIIKQSYFGKAVN